MLMRLALVPIAEAEAEVLEEKEDRGDTKPPESSMCLRHIAFILGIQLTEH